MSFTREDFRRLRNKALIRERFYRAKHYGLASRHHDWYDAWRQQIKEITYEQAFDEYIKRCAGSVSGTCPFDPYND